MKIGILTLHYGFNYGGVLQCYALQRTLESLGHEAIILDRIPRAFGSLYTIKRKFYHPWLHPEFADFRKRCLYPISKPLHSTADLENELDNGYDCCIVGSDQVWRKGVFSVEGDYFLQNIHLPGLKKIAYAASFGTKEWEYSAEETEAISNALKSFDYVSVRERDGVEMLQKHCNIKSECVLDPTLLANPKIYEHLRSRSKYNANGKLVTYILDWTTQIYEQCCEKAHKLGVEISHINPCPYDRKQTKSYTVYDWIQLLSTAHAVITDSFHGSVFSAIYGRQLTILGNAARGNSRFTALLELFDAQFNNNIFSGVINVQETPHIAKAQNHLINIFKDILS